MNDPDTWVKLIRTLQKEREERVILQKQIELNKPKVVFADAAAVSDSDILVVELAKILKSNNVEIGQNRLFEKLRKEGFLLRRDAEQFSPSAGEISRSQQSAREVQLQFMGKEAEVSARNLRTFDIGHRLEDLAAHWLRIAGFYLVTKDKNDEQFGFSAANGKIAGHVDGLIYALPKELTDTVKEWENHPV